VAHDSDLVFYLDKIGIMSPRLSRRGEHVKKIKTSSRKAAKTQRKSKKSSIFGISLRLSAFA